VGGEEFFIDLLFYHLKLRCYVVIELKAGKFKPEHLGQLSFYLTAVDAQVKHPDDGPTIGLLLFIALDKLRNQKLKQAIICVPEKSIGSSFNDEPLSEHGFFEDWQVKPQWNLCNTAGTDGGKVDAVGKFLESGDETLVCTHASFRFAVERYGVAAFDERLIAIDEFHHVSANPDNRLGGYLAEFMARDKCHIVAMTGSYFRGDAEAVLHPDDEAKFETADKTGVYLVTTADGKTLKIADLVDDEPSKRDKVSNALKDPEQKFIRDHVDIIIALGMAKEGFDWIWCEHALTVGYRSSLTEIVQIIGRATRDAPGKTKTRFTNLIAEPDASEENVTHAVNDTLKAIAASLLMEQVLAPRFDFRAKTPNSGGPEEGYDYGEGGYDPAKCNVGVNKETGQIQLEIKGLAMPQSETAKRICREDLNELITFFVQDKQTMENGMFNSEIVPEELTQVKMGKIVQERFPDLDGEDQEAVRQHAIAALNIIQQAKKKSTGGGDFNESTLNLSLIQGVRKFCMDVKELDIDLIDRINPFEEAYSILAKSMSEERLRQVAEVIAARKVSMSEEDTRELVKRAARFKEEKGRLPALTAVDPWEKRMAEGIAYLQRIVREKQNV
jgi:hypothetical protein